MFVQCLRWLRLFWVISPSRAQGSQTKEICKRPVRAHVKNQILLFEPLRARDDVRADGTVCSRLLNSFVWEPYARDGEVTKNSLSRHEHRTDIHTHFLSLSIMVSCFNIDHINRIHGEFQLNEPPLLPFWFTPAQFLGNIVISRDGEHVKSFHMAVPNNRSLNVGKHLKQFCFALTFIFLHLFSLSTV